MKIDASHVVSFPFYLASNTNFNFNPATNYLEAETILEISIFFCPQYVAKVL